MIRIRLESVATIVTIVELRFNTAARSSPSYAYALGKSFHVSSQLPKNISPCALGRLSPTRHTGTQHRWLKDKKTAGGAQTGAHVPHQARSPGGYPRMMHRRSVRWPFIRWPQITTHCCPTPRANCTFLPPISTLRHPSPQSCHFVSDILCPGHPCFPLLWPRSSLSHHCWPQRTQIPSPCHGP